MRESRQHKPRLRIWLAFVVALLLVPVAAAARPGDGIRMGPGRLRLGLEVETRYDSQAGSGIYGNTTNPADGILVARGSLRLDVPGQKFRANLAGGVDWNNYLGLFTPATGGVSGLSFLGVNLSGGLNVNPEGRGGFDATIGLSRSDRVTNPVFGLGVLGLRATPSVRGRYRPGGGALEFGLSYQFTADIYSRQTLPDDGKNSKLCTAVAECNPDLAAAFNALTNRVGFDAKWRFLQKTGLTFEADYGLRSYMHGREFIAQNEPAQPLRAVLGFGTLLTTRTTFSLRAGYQGMFFETAALPSLHTWIGQLELGYRLTETLQTRGGFLRSFDPVGGSLIYFGNNRLYWDMRAQFSRLVLTAQASVDLVGYGGTSLREDLAFNVGGRGEYNLTNWLRFVLGAGVSTRQVDGVVSTGVSSFTYSRWEITAGVATLF